jgi:hypothetical protein
VNALLASLTAFTAACDAYSQWVSWQRETELDAIEDELDRLASNASNESALYDPVTVTLKPSVRYQFVEGALEGRGQKFHSQYSYERAVIIGNKNYNW